ncbi:ABC transporter ATP-binding protein [Spiroplasma endosymbiont of Aspidapion aeneum]|uniref:ABC transporter ATP-binding protein n=1 Tax=Spiroplasma endosymbiont of Aspidapion aeneum TaxID=3066276 RepID=UPI00313E641C
MLEIKNLKKLYKNGAGISGVNINIEEGQIVGLIGKNGAGKTTLIKTIFNEINKNEGEIFFNGQNIDTQSVNYFSYLPDSPPVGVKVKDYLLYYAALNKIDKNSAKSGAEYLLNYFKLTEYANKTFQSLSAGMQKKALLACALIIKAKIIFLDEPTANLVYKQELSLLKF